MSVLLVNDFSRQDIETLKSSVDLCALMRSTGIELKPVGRNFAALCPWHEDKEASLVVNPEKQLYNCFGCGAKGDVLSFLETTEGLSFREAVKRLHTLGSANSQGFSGSDPGSDSGSSALLSGKAEFLRPELLGRVAEHYRKCFVESVEAQEYLRSRGLGDVEVWESFGIGYCDGTLLHTLPKKGEIRENLLELGILNEKGREHFLGCVIVPLEHPELGMVGMYGRRLNPKAKVRHLFLPGPKRGVFNWQVLQTADLVFVVEGVLDALSLWTAGSRNVTCLFGASGLPLELLRSLRASTVKELRFCLDADEAGSEGFERLAEEVRDRFTVSKVLLPTGSDPNALLVREGPELLRSFLDCVQSVDEGPSVADGLPLCETTDDGFTLSFDDAVYEITPKPPYEARLSVVIKGTRVDGKGRKFRDRCDLMAVRSRSATLRAMSGTLSLDKERAEVHLMEILDVAEDWVESVREAEACDESTVPVLSEAEKLEALRFLQAPGLVERILQDMNDLGYVGEERGKLLIYLVGVSRKLESPMSAIIRSQSGAGKSGMASVVAQMVPPEDVVHYSRVSAHALAYAERTAYKHKLLVMEERVGGEAADYYIRIMQSGHVIRQSVTIKDPVTGKMKAQDVEVEGPIAYIETTTAGVLNAENTSRVFEVYLDESEQQTGRIHERQREGRGLTRLQRMNRQKILERHHNAQRLLDSLPVVIPYVEHLTFPTKWLRTRRDYSGPQKLDSILSQK